MRKLKPALSTAAKIAEVTRLQVNNVTRLLRLADSPEVVQKGVEEGIKLPADAKNGADEQQRRLDLISALEFTRLYDAVSEEGRQTLERSMARRPAGGGGSRASVRALHLSSCRLWQGIGPSRQKIVFKDGFVVTAFM